METFVVSALVVAVSEIGDKTQLLSLFLAARFRRPVPVILAIAAATVLNHGLAATVGTWVQHAIGPGALRGFLGASFLAIAAWALIPDKLDQQPAPISRYGVFLLSLVAFFLAEMGDKTQIATAVLAAKHDGVIEVVGGTTLGMLCADVPAVLFGAAVPSAIPLGAVRVASAGLFAALGAATLLGVDFF